jgi:hypothetical protein
MLQDLSQCSYVHNFKTDQDLSHHLLLFKYLLELEITVLEADYLACYLHVVPIHTDIHYFIRHLFSFQFSYFSPQTSLRAQFYFHNIGYRDPMKYAIYISRLTPFHFKEMASHHGTVNEHFRIHVRTWLYSSPWQFKKNRGHCLRDTSPSILHDRFSALRSESFGRNFDETIMTGYITQWARI